MSGTVHPLHGAQRDAVMPDDTVWLSASAGTGKTQVLSARVLRLLLQENVSPSQILCLTFTKAGAAEMATRVNSVLARWVRMDEDRLGQELLAIGARVDPDTRQRARSLFAQVLDCPGGGLRIDTIHAFAQWLLATFPEEAGMTPGMRAMEDRDRDLLSREVLATMVDEAEQAGDRTVLDPLEMLGRRMGPDGARSWLARCAHHRQAWLGRGGWTGPLRARVLGLLGLSPGASRDDLAQLLADDRFAHAALTRCLAAQSAWGTKTGIDCAEKVGGWLALSLSERLEQLDTLYGALFTGKDEVRSLKSVVKHDPDYESSAEVVRAALLDIRATACALDLADWLTPALELGRAYAIRWDEAKQREGWLDFDDLIRQAADLLTGQPGADWIRYKLDRQFDHILVDEAQDTNEAQWRIVKALADDFFAGAGQHGDKARTLFVVGDYKQAIFGFQGTSPKNFGAARDFFADRIRAARANIDPSDDRAERQVRALQELSLAQSFRTSRPILDFVDAAIDSLGPDALGLERHEAHSGEDRPGLVSLWQPVMPVLDDGEDGGGGPSESGLDDVDYDFADRLARQVKAWIGAYPLQKHGRMAGPGDVMVLVRKRKELAGLIVARLYYHGVPVAGVDRLRLGVPLAVQDLMAALRFAAQPLDDLNLASLLVSPLLGWSQDDLLAHGWRGDKGDAPRLYDHLRRSAEPLVRHTMATLRALLDRADYDPPENLLGWLLTGPWQARRKLVSRLGQEANDPIDELVNAAFAFSASHTASLQGFIRWFDAGEGEVARDAGEGGDQVRVMTVHGSKGLQAPIVVLADATGDPDASMARALTLQQPVPDGVDEDALHRPEIPIPSMPAAEKPAVVLAAEAAGEAVERAEHWRLLYVAMTRAEEALFIGGAMTRARAKKYRKSREEGGGDDSWYARLEDLFDADRLHDPLWGGRAEWGSPGSVKQAATAASREERPSLPDWATQPVGAEPRPPRPLAPSDTGHDLPPDPPHRGVDGGMAARRGTLIHRLLERLPELPEAEREQAALRWLDRQAPDLPTGQRQEMATASLAVLNAPDFAAIFAPHALAEVPLTAVVAGQVITGTADRLLVEPQRITVVDFKTTAFPPAMPDDVPPATLRQMGAYVAALEAIYPGREIVAGVLYTHVPQMLAIPAEKLAANKPGFPA